MPASPKQKNRRPLATTTYLLRNARKTVPLTLVIMLSVLLVAGIVSMIDSIPHSIRTIYAYTKYSLGVTPRGDPTLTARMERVLRAETPVPLERIIVCRVSSTQVKSIVGKWPFAVIGLSQEDLAFQVKRLQARSLQGRLPKAGAPEALVSEPVARNLGLKIGSALQGPDQPESYSPYPVKVVGIANSDLWFMLASIEYQRENHFPPLDNLLVCATNLKDQDRLDKWAVKRFKGERTLLFSYHLLEKDTDEMFQILYKVLNVVIGTLVLVITFMMGMLMNIYQSHRLVEFGLLQALGYTRRQLLRRVTMESLAVIVFGWAMGVLLAYLLLNVVKVTLMDPHAFALDVLDPAAYRYTIPIPVALFATALFTVWYRFRDFDPIGVVERRLV